MSRDKDNRHTVPGTCQGEEQIATQHPPVHSTFSGDRANYIKITCPVIIVDAAAAGAEYDL